MRDTSDEELMTAVMAGNQVAMTELVTRHHSPLFGYLFRLLGGDRAQAEDLVQETLLRALRPGAYIAPRPFKPWFYAIATNLARDHLKSAAERYRERVSNVESALLQLSDNSPGPEERALAAERGGEAQAAIAQLGEEYRAVVILRFYQEFSLQEIAETLRIPLGTVKSRLSVGVHRLRALLTAVGEGVE
jgi:RNA polymerase sigma-70 factor, ECF subfamily